MMEFGNGHRFKKLFYDFNIKELICLLSIKVKCDRKVKGILLT